MASASWASSSFVPRRDDSAFGSSLLVGPSSCRAAKLIVVEVRELVVDGAPTEYRVAGEGEPLVLVHGLSGSWRWWTPVLEPLAERRCVHLLDLPRLGRRLPAAELAGWLGRWLEAAALESVDLVGHSLGGLIAAELAAAQPQRARRLALVAPAGIPCGTQRAESRRTACSGRCTTSVDGSRRSPATRCELGRSISCAEPCSHPARDLRAWSSRRFRARTLLVWGEHDRLLPARIAAEWQRILPGSRLVRLPAGTCRCGRRPEELASCLLAFLDEELADDPCDEIGPGVVHGVRFTGDDDEPTAR